MTHHGDSDAGDGPGFMPEVVDLASVIREAPTALQRPLLEAAAAAVTAAHERGCRETLQGMHATIESNIRHLEATAVARVVQTMRAHGVTITVHELLAVCRDLDIPLRAMPMPTREPNPEDLS